MALLLVLSTVPVAVLADPVVLWARTIERDSVPTAGDNPPVAAPVPLTTPVMACKERLTAADVTEIDLINFKVTPEAASYPECAGVPSDDISRLCAALLKLGQGSAKAAEPGPQPYVPPAPATSDPLADWLEKYAGHIIGALTLAVTATVGYFTVAHTRHQMRQSSQAALLDLPKSEEPAGPAEPERRVPTRSRAGRTGGSSRRTRSRA